MITDQAPANQSKPGQEPTNVETPGGMTPGGFHKRYETNGTTTAAP